MTTNTRLAHTRRFGNVAEGIYARTEEEALAVLSREKYAKRMAAREITAEKRKARAAAKITLPKFSWSEE